MFGPNVDYRILRAMAHTRNRATEAELDARSGSSLAPREMLTKLPSVIARFQGHFPIAPNLRYLDMGCGSGELTIGLAQMGLKRIVGVDFLPRFVESARANALRAGVGSRVQFECADLRRWQPAEKFDVLLSFDAFEHIAEPAAFLRRMRDFLGPRGVAVVSFGPLFHSPFGDHMGSFFRFPLPWRGALFNEQAMLRVRRECFRPTDPGTRYADIAGGLNGMRFTEFLRAASASGWRFRSLAVNQFARLPVLTAIAGPLGKLPGLRDYAVHNVYAVMEAPAPARPERMAA